ncbi:class I SAM-dependent methyltransferase [Candidatus Latescibacterota bacterium]
MDTVDKEKIIERYEERLGRLGPVPESLGWLRGRQNFRFHFLRQIEDFALGDSVLDVGCGFGDCYAYLRSVGWNGEYCGVDIVPGLISEGCRKYPNLDLRVLDIQEESLGRRFDWVFCSGALTSRIEGDTYEHFRGMIGKMFGAAAKGVAVNFLSPLVDFSHEVHFHPDFGEIAGIIAKLSKRFTLRHDYMPYEFTAYIYSDSGVNVEANVFSRHNEIYARVGTFD